MSETDEHGFGFERLEIWRRARGLAAAIYEVTGSFPKQEVYGLTMQLRRASVSVAANIAEGTSRISRRDQVRFFEIAYGSLSEIAAILQIAADQGLVSEGRLPQLRSEMQRMCRMLSGLRRSALGGTE